MALVVKDRVKETTTTTGTGTITLAGAVDGFQSFSAALADGDTTYYAISETSTGEWEVGLGTFTATGTTLARTTVLASSNAGSAVSLTAEADVFITQPASKSVFFDGSGDLTLNQDPTSALHAATKEYVDTIAAAGLHYHDPVRVEQEGNLSATYDNGTAGVGATLTNNSTQAALSIDGVTLSLNDRVLIYEQTNAYENGVYTVTDTGSASTNWVLTRSTDTDSYAPSDPDSLGQGDAFFVLEGTAGAGELYVMNTEGTITFGTTGITFTQVAATAVFTAGDGLTLTGTTFAVGAGTGVTVNANDIAIGQAVGTSDSPTFAGMTTTGDITFGSNDKASFGTTLDIYSDGTDSYVVEGGTGNLYIDSADLSIRNAAGTATMASFDDTGSVTLNHNNSTKLTTQSYGIDVTGNVQSDGLIVDGDATFDTNTLFVDSTNNRVGIGNIAPATALDVSGTVTADGLTVSTSGTNSEAYFDNGSKSYRLLNRSSDNAFSIYDNTASAFRLTTASNGDISFYEDTGTTAKFFWDASAERLGIGNASPTNTLDVTGSFKVVDGNNTIDSSDANSYPRITTNNSNAQLGLFRSGTSAGGGYLGANADASLLVLDSSFTERVRVDSNGNVGIGTSSPTDGYLGAAALDVSGPVVSRGAISSHQTNAGVFQYNSNETAIRSYGATAGSGQITFSTGGGGSADTERMRIDASGSLLVGGTSAEALGSTTLYNTGQIVSRVDGTYAAEFRRDTSDGNIVTFRKDGSTVGSIGTAFGYMHLGEGVTGLGFRGADNTIYPYSVTGAVARDAAIKLGSSTYRFSDLYLSGAAYTHSIAKQTTDPIVINSTLSSSKALRVYYDMDIYNTINFTDSSWNVQGRIAGSSGNLNLTPATGGSVQITSTNDAMLKLIGSDTWAGISFDDSGAVTDYIWYNGTYGTFAIGGGGSSVSGKKLHVDGGMTIGVNYDTTTPPTNGLTVEGDTNIVGGVYTNDWFRNYTSGYGLYNQATTQHFYSDDDDWWNIAGGSAANGLRFRDDYGTTVRGSVYANQSNQIGFLDAGGNWAIQHANDTGTYFYTDNGTEEFKVGRDTVTGGYGTVQTATTKNGWGGYSINGQYVFMSNHGDYCGIYNDIDDEWIFYAQRNGPSYVYYDGSSRLQTTSAGVTVTGTCTATAFSGDGSGLTNLPSGTSSSKYVVDGYSLTNGTGGASSGWDTDGDNNTTPSDALNYIKYGDIIPLDSSLSTAKGVFCDLSGTTIGGLQWAQNSYLHAVVNYKGWSSRWITRNPTTTTNYGALKMDSVEGLVFQCTDPAGDIVGYSFDTVFAVDGKGATCSAFNAVSDIKLKENIELIDDPVAKLQGLNGYSYNFKATGKAAYGVIAQEVEEVLPHAVAESKEVKTVDYNAIVALLVETVKKQEQRIAELEKKVGA